MHATAETSLHSKLFKLRLKNRSSSFTPLDQNSITQRSEHQSKTSRCQAMAMPCSNMENVHSSSSEQICISPPTALPPFPSFQPACRRLVHLPHIVPPLPTKTAPGDPFPAPPPRPSPWHSDAARHQSVASVRSAQWSLRRPARPPRAR